MHLFPLQVSHAADQSIPPHHVFFLWPIREIRGPKNEATMLSQYIQKTSRIKYKKPAKPGC